MRSSIIGLGLLLAFLRPAAAETLCVYTEERIAGEEAALPLPGREGLLESLFESEHVVFESEISNPAVDWQEGRFEPVLQQAREGGARFLLAARFLSTHLEPAPRVEIGVEYFLLPVSGARPIVTGRLRMDNAGREREVGFRELASELGREVGRQLIRDWPASTRVP